MQEVGAQSGAGRNASVDVLRFVGALGIVLFHMGLPGAWIGLSALPMFVALIVFYGMGRSPRHHARRLLVPWLIWSAIFGVAKIAQAGLHGAPLISEFAPWMVLTGTALHLWFLPFAFVFLAGAWAVLRFLPGFMFWGLCVCGAVVSLWAVNALTLPTPVPQWFSTLPAAFAGAAMARTGRSVPVLALVAGGAAGAIGLAGWHGASWQLLIAALSMALALNIRMSPTRVSDWMAQVSFGIYLIHPLVYALCLMVLPRYSWGTFAVTVAGSILGTMAMRRLWPASV